MSEEPQTTHPLAEATVAEAETADHLERKALETLGNVAAKGTERRPMVFDSKTGMLMTPGDMKGELEYRKANGRKS
jgi:hypothetical protein